MKFVLKISFLLLISTTFVYSQEQSRLQKLNEFKKVSYQIQRTKNPSDKLRAKWQKLMEEVFSVSDEDLASAKKIGAKAVRLFPDGVMDRFLDKPDSFGASIYPFTEISEYYFAPLLEFANNSFYLQRNSKDKEIHGFIANVGKIAIENVNEQNLEFTALAAYQPPNEEKNIKKFLTFGQTVFRRNAPIRVGETYLLRVVYYFQGDRIFVLKVQRKDIDGSIIIFIKTLKQFNPPKLILTPRKETTAKTVILDEKLVAKVTKALRRKGFKNVQVEVGNPYLIIKGTVPKGKLAEALITAQSASGTPVKNEVTEQ